MMAATHHATTQSGTRPNCVVEVSRCRGVEVSRCRGVEVSRCRATFYRPLQRPCPLVGHAFRRGLGPHLIHLWPATHEPASAGFPARLQPLQPRPNPSAAIGSPAFGGGTSGHREPHSEHTLGPMIERLAIRGNAVAPINVWPQSGQSPTRMALRSLAVVPNPAPLRSENQSHKKGVQSNMANPASSCLDVAMLNTLMRSLSQTTESHRRSHSSRRTSISRRSC